MNRRISNSIGIVAVLFSLLTISAPSAAIGGETLLIDDDEKLMEISVLTGDSASENPLSDDDAAGNEARSSDTEALAELTTCSKPTALSFFPVRGKHDTGWQSEPDPAEWRWTCNAKNSNGEFFDHGCNDDSHFGIDIFAKEGVPVVATVAGEVIEAEFYEDSGNTVTIRDACGWDHFSIHMKSIAKGIKQGTNVLAGQLIGYVGNTGDLSGDSMHLHYSVYPDGNYCEGIDPHPLLLKVEKDVCWLPASCENRVCGKNEFCFNGTRCCPTTHCRNGCPC